MESDSKRPARWEVLAWDGCGMWLIWDEGNRRESRDCKRHLASGWESMNLDDGLFMYGRVMWPTIKIWDRKRKELIT